MLILILIFAPSLGWLRITYHYCNNAWWLLWFGYGSSPEDGTELWQRRCWHLWFEAVGMQDGAGASNSKRRRLNIEGKSWKFEEELERRSRS
jgi:hypothetical protein